MKKRFIPFAVIAAVILSSCGEVASSETTDKKEDASSTEKSTTKSTEDEADKAETTTVNGVEIKIIPGLAAIDVHSSMEKIGFETEKNIGAEISTWRSKMSDESGNYEVAVTGNGPEKITSVDARYSSLTDADMKSAAEFMQYVSTVPYKGANAEIAKAWVDSHANKGGDTLINGVKFRITARDNMSRGLYINVPD